SLQLSNFLFMPLQPADKLNDFLNMADIHLVIQKTNASDLVMPSKLTPILAVGGLAVITAPVMSSLYKIINNHKMGILAEPENQAALAKAIESALNQSDKKINDNARNYAKQYLSINQILRRFTEDMASS
ncbi:MAG: glycosyltransferase, partial [Janthinobacterium lividum]